jgi:hypothetical protein
MADLPKVCLPLLDTRRRSMKLAAVAMLGSALLDGDEFALTLSAASSVVTRTQAPRHAMISMATDYADQYPPGCGALLAPVLDPGS